MMSGAERRRLERFELEIPATVEVISDLDQEERRRLNLLTSDICSGGAYFHTDEPLAEGTQVNIDLVLSRESLKKLSGKQAYIKVSGKVIRSEAKGMAICFSPNYRIRAL